MGKNKTKQLVQGAALVAVYAILGIINIMFGTLFDIIFIYTMTIALVIYTYTYESKYGWIVLISSFIVLWIIGELYFVFMGIATNACGIVYAILLKNKKDKKNNILKGVLIIKNCFIFMIIDSFLGLDALSEGYVFIESFVPNISYSFFLVIMLLILCLMSLAESAIIRDYSKFVMVKMNIRTN